MFLNLDKYDVSQFGQVWCINVSGNLFFDDTNKTCVEHCPEDHYVVADYTDRTCRTCKGNDQALECRKRKIYYYPTFHGWSKDSWFKL